MKIKTNGNKNIQHEKINAKLGLTNKKNHTTFFLEGSFFITPEIEHEDYNNIIHNIKNSCKTLLKSKLYKSTILDTSFLMNINVCSDRMKINKKTYISFQYHFKQKQNNSIIDIKKDNENFFIGLLNDLENNFNDYQIKISKKR